MQQEKFIDSSLIGEGSNIYNLAYELAISLGHPVEAAEVIAVEYFKSIRVKLVIPEKEIVKKYTIKAS